MKQVEVLAKERTKIEAAAGDVATKLGLTLDEYRRIEEGETPAEIWGARLAWIAVTLECPTARLLAESGRFEDCGREAGQVGRRIRFLSLRPPVSGTRRLSLSLNRLAFPLFHLLTQTQRAHFGPDFFDVAEAFLLRPFFADVIPTRRIL